MSGATPWSVNGLDPKTQDAAQEQARKHGMTLGEWLNQSILAHEEAARLAQDAPSPGPYVGPELENTSGDWTLNGGDTRRMGEALERLAERIDATERRAALSMTGLDRTVLGLAARVEDAEAGVRQASAKVSGAVEEIRRTGDAITERVTHAELLAREAAGEVSTTLQDFAATRQAMVQRLAEAEEGARRAAEEVSATVLAESRDSQAELAARIENAEAFSREVAAAAAVEIRAAQESLAERMSIAEQDAREAALEAVRALRADQKSIEDRLAFAEASGREIAAETMRELQGTQASMHDRLRQVELETRRATSEAIADVRQAHAELADRVASAGLDERTAEFLRDIETAQHGLATRFEAIEAIARQTADSAAFEVAEGQHAIEARLEQIEQATREAAANLRMGAAAAINQVRAAQLDLEKRVKMVEVGATFGGGVDGDRMRETHSALEERLDRIERNGGGNERAALHMLDAKITGLAATVRDSRDRTVAEIESLHTRIETGGTSSEYATRLTAVEKTVEDAIARLADRLVKAETTANDALRQLESAPGAKAETEVLRTMVEARLDDMAKSMTQMVGGVRAEIAGKLGAEGSLDIDQSLQEVHQRVALSERRQSQTIEAISIEIRRMSESIDRRLRNLETRNDDSAAIAVREEVARLANALEDRVGGLENREIASVDRVGVEMGRLAERFDERFDGVERRSAEAIEHVGEQVARMAERFSVRQDQVARELTERIVESEERQASRLTETIATVASKLSAVEERTTTTLSPVQKAMSSLAARLQAVEDGSRGALAGFDSDLASGVLASEPDAIVDDFKDDLDGSFVPPIDLSNFDSFVEQMAAPAIDNADKACAEAEDSDSVDVDSMRPATFSFDAFDTLLPELPETAAPTAADAKPLVHAEANALAFPWDEPGHAGEATPATHDEDLDVFAPAAAPIVEKPPGKNDYLANARRAAQSNNQSGKKRAQDADDHAPVQGLRGPNRVVLWSAAGALAVALAGGAYLVKVRANGETAAEPEVAPDTGALAVAPTPTAAPEAPDSTALAPVDGAALSDVPLAPVDGAVTSSSSIADAAARAQAEARVRETAKATAKAARVEPAPTRSGTRGPQAGISASVQNVALSASGGRAGLSLEQAALRGDAVAQYELGLQRLAGNQTPEGVALLRRAANQGLAMAQYRLAKLFERGEGVPSDIAQARQWTERAAAAGNRKAMHDLGVYYARGEGAPLDEATAFRWFKQAAELGVADSQFNLGVLYQQGRGAAANANEALFWFAVAARSGDNDARARAATLEAQLSPELVQQVRGRASTYTARPASARANGEFGQRVWSSDSAQATPNPRS